MSNTQPNDGVTLSVEWGYEAHSLSLTREQWTRIVSGSSLDIVGPGYQYEREHFQDTWHFNGGIDGELRVTYARAGGSAHDEADGFVGTVRHALMSEDASSAEG